MNVDKDFLRQIENVDELIPQKPEKLANDILICECFCVSAGDIRELCSTEVDVDLLIDQLSLGQGCQSCLKRRDDWIHKIF